MWNVLASILAIAIFSVVVLMLNSRATAAIQELALQNAQTQAATVLAQFAMAARSNAAARGYGSGTVMTVSSLQSDGALPAAFPATDAFGLTLRARVGNVSPGSVPVVAWTDGVPLQLFGLPVNSITIRGVQMQVAQMALGAQQNSGALAGVAQPGGALLMPYATTAMSLSSVFPGWAPANPNATIVYMN